MDGSVRWWCCTSVARRRSLTTSAWREGPTAGPNRMRRSDLWLTRTPHQSRLCEPSLTRSHLSEADRATSPQAPWKHLSVAAAVLPTDLVGSLVRLRRLEKAADTLAHRRAAEAAMNRLLAAALAPGWTGREVGPVLGTTARNVYMRAQRGRRLGDCFGLALPADGRIPMLDGRLHPAGSTM
jgi:hypothetical protein